MILIRYLSCNRSHTTIIYTVGEQPKELKPLTQNL